MTYLEKLRLSKFKSQVAYQEFSLSTRKYSEHLFCFFEGKDNSYYVPRIKRFTDNYFTIKCGGRDSVIDVCKLINNHSEYDRYKKAFFIDRDFHAPLESSLPPIFETPCYSIENLYVSVDVFKEILLNEFHLAKINDKEIFDVCISLFLERQKEFHIAISLLNAWYACLIDMGSIKSNHEYQCLDDKLPKKFINISLGAVTSDYDLQTIKRTFPIPIDVDENLLKNKLELFRNCIHHKVFRGKYELQFLIKFIQLLLKDSTSTKIVLKDKIHFAFGDGSGLNNEQALNIFEGYAETPESLLEYLKLVLK